MQKSSFSSECRSVENGNLVSFIGDKIKFKSGWKSKI